MHLNHSAGWQGAIDASPAADACPLVNQVREIPLVPIRPTLRRLAVR